MQYQLGIIGGGNMAEAIVRAALSNDVLAADALVISDPDESRRAIFDRMGIKAIADNRHVVDNSQQVMLAIKPQMLDQIAPVLRAVDAKDQVLLSIMAGIRCAKLMDTAGRELRIIRIMPNTPLLVGQGMSAVALGGSATPDDATLALRLLCAAGEAERVDESMMDAVTAVSGSGPAYLFYLAEAMRQAAEELQIPQSMIDQVVEQTIFGAATLLRQSDAHARELRERVTSPGGTTEAAINHMESRVVRQLIVDAIHRAAWRSRELGDD